MGRPRHMPGFARVVACRTRAGLEDSTCPCHPPIHATQGRGAGVPGASEGARQGEVVPIRPSRRVREAKMVKVLICARTLIEHPRYGAKEGEEI